MQGPVCDCGCKDLIRRKFSDGTVEYECLFDECAAVWTTNQEGVSE